VLSEVGARDSLRVEYPLHYGDLEKGTIGQKLFRYESVSHPADRQLDSQLPPPLYSPGGDEDLQLGSRYVYPSETTFLLFTNLIIQGTGRFITMTIFAMMVFAVLFWVES
jgi:hypothetical protein